MVDNGHRVRGGQTYAELETALAHRTRQRDEAIDRNLSLGQSITKSQAINAELLGGIRADVCGNHACWRIIPRLHGLVLPGPPTLERRGTSMASECLWYVKPDDDDAWMVHDRDGNTIGYGLTEKAGAYSGRRAGIVGGVGTGNAERSANAVAAIVTKPICGDKPTPPSPRQGCITE